MKSISEKLAITGESVLINSYQDCGDTDCRPVTPKPTGPILKKSTQQNKTPEKLTTPAASSTQSSPRPLHFPATPQKPSEVMQQPIEEIEKLTSQSNTQILTLKYLMKELRTMLNNKRKLII